MASPDEAPARYAAALAELAAAAGRAAAVERDLPLAAETIGASSDVARFLANPAVSDEGRRATARELLGEAIDPLVVRFVDLLIDLDAWRLLPAIADAYRALTSQRNGRGAGLLRSAVPLDEARRTAIEHAVSARLGRPVALALRTDPSLIGGFVAQVGDFVFDGSIEHQLETVRARLLGADTARL